MVSSVCQQENLLIWLLIITIHIYKELEKLQRKKLFRLCWMQIKNMLNKKTSEKIPWYKAWESLHPLECEEQKHDPRRDKCNHKNMLRYASADLIVQFPFGCNNRSRKKEDDFYWNSQGLVVFVELSILIRFSFKWWTFLLTKKTTRATKRQKRKKENETTHITFTCDDVSWSYL